MKEIMINDKLIATEDIEETTVNGKKLITVRFLVSHEEYHAVTTLLYEPEFHLEVPERGLTFNASIYNYSTDVVDLYQPGSVGEFKVTFKEK